MNPLGKVVHLAAGAAGTAVGLAETGLRTTARVAGWAIERAAGRTPDRGSSQWETTLHERTQPDDGSAPATAQPEPAPQPEPQPAPVTSTTARKAPSKRAAVVAPALGLTEAQAEDVLRTPSGIPAAGDGVNPDTTETDLHQPGTEPIMDPATVKAVASESEMLSRAADPDKG